MLSLLAVRVLEAPFVPRIVVRGRPRTFPPRAGETLVSLGVRYGPLVTHGCLRGERGKPWFRLGFATALW